MDSFTITKPVEEYPTKPMEEHSTKPMEEQSKTIDFSKRLPTIPEVSNESVSLTPSSTVPDADTDMMFSYDMYAKCYSSDSSDDPMLFNHISIPNHIIPDTITDTRHTLDKTIATSHKEVIEKELSLHIDPTLSYCFCCNDDSVLHDNACNWKF
jgi:hypothetical protein